MASMRECVCWFDTRAYAFVPLNSLLDTVGHTPFAHQRPPFVPKVLILMHAFVCSCSQLTGGDAGVGVDVGTEAGVTEAAVVGSLGRSVGLGRGGGPVEGPATEKEAG